MTTTDPTRNAFEQQPETAFFGPRPGHGWELWAVFAIATVAAAALQSWRAGPSAWVVVTGAGLIAATGAAMLPRGARLPAPWAWGTAAAAALLAQLAVLGELASGRAEGYTPWYVNGTTIVCSVLILRRRAGAGWACFIAAYSGILLLGAATGAPFAQGGYLTVRQAAALVAIQVFAILLAHGQEAIAALQQEERTRLTVIQLREMVMEHRRAEAERLRDLVAATLQRIADEDTSAELRREATLLEGALRDALRGRRIAAGPVPFAARAARERGLDVVLLDDLGDPGEGRALETVPDAALAWVASRLSAAEPPRATVRLAAGGDGRTAISFYAEGTEGAPDFLPVEPFVASPSSTRAGR